MSGKVDDAEMGEEVMTAKVTDGDVRDDPNRSGAWWKDAKWGVWNTKYIKDATSDEGTGYIMIGGCRGPLNGWLAVYTVIALTGLAEQVEDCRGDLELLPGWSVKSSSLVATVLVIDGIVNALLAAMMTAFVDSTPHRTAALRTALLTVATVVFLAGLSMFGAGESWAILAFAGFLLIASLAYEVMTVLHNSYLAELHHEDSERVRVAGKMYTLLNATQLSYIIVALGVTSVFGVASDKIGGPQVGAVISVLGFLYFGLPGMLLMQPRPKIEEHNTHAGFLGLPRLWKSIMLCYNQYTQVGIFFIGYSFYTAGVLNLVGLASTYLLEETGFEGFDLQVLVGITLLFTVPGAASLKILNRKFKGNLKYTIVVVLCYWLVVVAMIPVLLFGGDEEVLRDDFDVNATCFGEKVDIETKREASGLSSFAVYIVAVTWGFALGLVFPMGIAVGAVLFPGGEEATMFGLRTFAGKIFSFAPALIYAGINDGTAGENEKIGNLRVAIVASIFPFIFIGLVILVVFLDFDKAREQIKHTLHLRHGYKERMAALGLDDLDG